MSNIISKRKANYLWRNFQSGNLNISEATRLLGISRNTTKRYLSMFRNIISEMPTRIFENECDSSIFTPVKKEPSHNDELNTFFIRVTHHNIQLNSATELWLRYISQYSDGIKYSQFMTRFNRWKAENDIIDKSRKRCEIKEIPEEDLVILKKWRRSSNRREFELAILILESYKGASVEELSIKLDRCKDKIRDWINAYNTEGLNGFSPKPRNRSQIITDRILEKHDNLIKLIHETPKLHGINRTSWSQKDLSVVYEKVYGIKMSTSTISEYLKKEGYVYRKAREVLTSPDPEFREKLDHIKSILSKLGDKERFFSIDEFGPFAVKIKGGRSLVKKNEFKTFPQVQKSKGFTICTAALELSRNQVSHFYSTKKNTDEMIKMIHLLLHEYKDQDKLYLSWDAASWHSSKKLVKHIKEINSKKYRELNRTPLIELAPLPSSAQFLNVIESVFSGLAKSIIHNSDYQSLAECKHAIDLYFNDRNKYFVENPQKAGKQIWGKEIVKPVFSETNNSKDPKCR